ncbi:MAG: tRNA (N(6)-L-threonylcarbamoyladenosine(37)-C(2))-methylthiotransferase MtaB [Cyanobacteria bacterium SIG31]|nr:tRNA (N(6)-L-threonylcarbamoyladenosine(37)-C(2))-methylthiotransferase MtaB [Cyanobacteria bacterium SIG31]
MKKFYLKSMGCKSNQFEGQIVSQKLVEAGFEEVKKLQDADVYILNSCSVTHKSDNEAMYHLRHAKNLGLKTILTGCVAQIEKEKLLLEPFIDAVYGNEDKFNIVELIKNEEEYAVLDLMNKKEFCNVTLNDTSKTRISLKIQDGCDNRCAYCIIPYGRGKSRSASSDFIINEINRYASQGYKEVVFTGIHIGLWGKDININGKELSLLDLLKDIEAKTSIPRYRLGSLNPLEISPEMLDFLQNSEKFCPHFHLSLQSACNSTLKRMNRHYSVEYYLDQIEDIVSRFNKPFLGSDIIAGFVGETDKDFEITVENLKKSKLSQIHTFPYSIRKGTIAEKLQGHLPDEIKEERASIIKQISAKKFEEFLKSNIGLEQEVLIEKRLDRKTGLYKGITRNYINVLLKDGEYNTLKNVTLSKDNIVYTTHLC